MTANRIVGSLTLDCSCHPNYLSAKAHATLSKQGAFEGLRIHTDEINEVIAKIRAGSLSIAIVSTGRYTQVSFTNAPR